MVPTFTIHMASASQDYNKVPMNVLFKAPFHTLGICLTNHPWLEVGEICKSLYKTPILPIVWFYLLKILRVNLVAFQNSHPLSSVFLMFSRIAVNCESQSSWLLQNPFIQKKARGFSEGAQLIHTLHKQPDFAEASPRGRNLSFLETSLQHQLSSPSKRPCRNKLGISQHRRRAGKNQCHCMDSSIQFTFQNSS